MEIDRSVVNYISTTLYNILPIEQSIKQLWGYDDRNFSLVDSSDHQTYILKITNERDSKPELADIVDEILDSAHSYFSSLRSTEFVVPKLMRTSANKLSTLVGINVRNSITGDLELKHCNVKLFEYFDGITLYDYVQSKGSNLDALAETYLRVGRLSGQLFDFLHTQNHLIEQLRKCRQKFTWQLATCEPFLREWLTKLSLADAERSLLVKEVLDEYRAVEQKLKALPQFVVHSDLSLRNMLLGKNSMCLVDFGDAQVGNQLTDLAVAMLHSVLEQESDFRESLRRIPAQMLRGYRLANKSSICKLNEEDLDLALTLMKLRLCQSLANAYAASLRDPGNSCTTTTLKNGWNLLEILVRDPQYSKPSMMAKLWRDASSS